MSARDIGRPRGYGGVPAGLQFDENGYELPDAPENPDFVTLFTNEQQEAIDKRFRNGIELSEIYDARAKRLVREASLACHARFNKPCRPTRKQRELRVSLADVARAPRKR